MSLTTVCGLHAVKAAIEASPQDAQRMLVDRKRRDKRMQSLIDLARHHSIKLELVSREELEQQSAGQTHQGVVLFTRGAKQYSENDLDEIVGNAGELPLVLVLDGITDPHNLGACLRTADAAGVDLVIAPKDKAVGITATVRKTASGATESVPFIQVTNLSRALKQLQQAGLWVTGTTMSGSSLYEADLTGPRVIVMGSEGKGMRRLTQEHCDQLVHIPMSGKVESLKVSVATGVVLFEVVRQRQLKGS